MSKRARRGLGFVVLAFLLWLIAIAVRDVDDTLFALVALAMAGAGVYGLVLLAWGLIRD